ncbi:MAG TPA: NAD+ synthase [Bacteroidota bacterium]|nr:NAD+ synthase [Bacteroidota bacterium]
MEAPSKDHQDLLRINAKTVRNLLVQFLKDETAAAGFSKGIVGLSGGVDSAVVAYLTAEALGKKNVLAVIMPARTSSKESVEDAQLVAKELGIHSELVDISPMVDAYCEPRKISDRVRVGNVMARMRMIVLYDVSAREKALVIGTSNKTELMVGYGTQFGDMACALNPIGDLYKTQVWQLAKELGVPEKIIAKKPTADLWPGQTDEGELGILYKDLDALLYAMIDERRTGEELEKLGFRPKTIDKVREMVRRSQFKRRPPILAKVSYRTANVDFRYARDWGV